MKTLMCSAAQSRVNLVKPLKGWLLFAARTLPFIALSVTFVAAAEAFLQDQTLESALRRSDAQALSLLPAKGYANGAAGFFRDYDVYVVPDTERAWCADKAHGILPPGCYIEFHFQQQGRRARTADGTPCGFLGRWHRAPGSTFYQATAGAYYSLAIARGNYVEVVRAFDEPALPLDFKQLRQTNECESSAARVSSQSAPYQDAYGGTSPGFQLGESVANDAGNARSLVTVPLR